jgi:methionine-S-sulfoxide reductase
LLRVSWWRRRARAFGSRSLPPRKAVRSHRRQSTSQPTRWEPPRSPCSPVAAFGGVQGVFQHVEGVTNAVSGYAGGEKASAQYETVSTGTTGHAESVRITFDPHRVSFGRILQVYFSVAHDPTQLNFQGPDTGTQYRSAIFPTTPEQARSHQDRARPVLLPGRGFPSGLPRAEPELSLHRLQRPSQDREPEAHPARCLSRGARPGFRRSFVELKGRSASLGVPRRLICRA